MTKIYRTLLTNTKSNLMRLSLLGILTGISAGFVIILFRLLVEETQRYILPGNNPENYEALPYWAIFTLPLLGGIILGAIFHFISPEKRQVGVVHTLQLIKANKTRLPVANTIAQFFGAAISIICGHSVGREGPSIHMGAGSGSMLASVIGVKESTRPIMLASGVAAAIAASFNTPIAGVIFALEVILLEYSVASMMPIILAASAATLMSQQVFGNEAALKVPEIINITGYDYISIIINGILIGLLAVIFIRTLLKTTAISKDYPIFWRLTAAGAITGLLALFAPEIMSLGYDTINLTFSNSIVLSALILILMLKILATAVGLGLGLPGGLIGPTLVMGALCGGAFGIIINGIFDTSTSPAVYAMIGMGAMMSATLQAPLAALMAIFELTNSPEIILPGLLAIAAASLTSSEILHQPSVFFALMQARETDQDADTPDKTTEDNKQLP